MYTWLILQFCGRSGPTHGNAVLTYHTTSWEPRLIIIDTYWNCQLRGPSLPHQDQDRSLNPVLRGIYQGFITLFTFVSAYYVYQVFKSNTN